MNESEKYSLSSNDPEAIKWRYEQAMASARIEGIKPNPEYENFVQNLRNEGFSEREVRRKFTEMLLNRKNTLHN